MAHIIELDAEEAGKKLSLIKTYFREVIVVALVCAVIYLFVGQKNLEHDMRSYLENDRVSATNTIQQNNTLLIEIKELLYSIKNFINSKNK